jgi:hypothetical protein
VFAILGGYALVEPISVNLLDGLSLVATEFGCILNAERNAGQNVVTQSEHPTDAPELMLSNEHQWCMPRIVDQKSRPLEGTRRDKIARRHR